MDYGLYADVEKHIQKALTALSENPKLNVAAAARQFVVPSDRLRARRKGRQSRMDRNGPGERLNLDQQKALEAYLKRCDELDMPALGPQLIHAAQGMIDRALPPGVESTPLSKNWLPRYLNRHPHMRRTKQKTKEIDRSACEVLELYERHFRDFKKVVDENGIPPGDIYNMDEIGFRIRIGGAQWVITLDI